MNQDPPTTRLANPERSIRLNLAVSFSYQIISVLVNVFLVPLYIRHLGMESVGLLAFFATLQMLSRVLDMGMSSALLREIARVRHDTDGSQQTRNLFLTFERLFGFLAIAITITLVLSAPLLASSWLRAEALSERGVVVSVALMGVLCGLSWINSYYQSVLLGLERHVEGSLIRIAELLITTGGIFVVVGGSGADVQIVFAWQVLMAAIMVAVTRWIIRRHMLNLGARPEWKPDLIIRIWRGAVGMSIISVNSIILLQMDRAVLSRLLPLDRFGVYTTALMVANLVPAAIVGPTFSVMFPRFSNMTKHGSEQFIQDLYRVVTQMLGAIIIPATFAMIVFGERLVFHWTRNAQLAADIARVLPALAISYACNVMAMPPFILQLAKGWMKPTVVVGTVLVLVCLPLTILLSRRYGMQGAALAMLAMNASQLIVISTVAHRRLLPGESLHFFGRDMIPMIAICGGITFGVHLFDAGPGSILLDALVIFVISFAMVVLCVLTSSHLPLHVRALLATRMPRPTNK